MINIKQCQKALNNLVDRFQEIPNEDYDELYNEDFETLQNLINYHKELDKQAKEIEKLSRKALEND